MPTLRDVVVVILGKEGVGKREVAVVEKLLMSGETVVVALEKGKRSGRGVLSHDHIYEFTIELNLPRHLGLSRV